ncbi:LysE family translocator [Humitalea rosea]|nr:LysE family translocator [Humitalea rosea]
MSALMPYLEETHLDAAWFASVLAFALSTTATPGPNNAMVMASGATWGLRLTVPHILGISLGFAAMMLALALGVGGVFRAAPWLYGVLRWLGAAYLLWLAWRIATARPGVARGRSASRPFGFFQAAAFQWVNPKAWAIGVGAVVTFLGDAGPLVQAFTLTGLFLAVTLPITIIWALMGVGAGRMLQSEGALVWFNRVLAVLLVASLVPMLL